MSIKEYQVQTIDQPYGVKIEKNSKGYNYEVSIHSDTPEKAVSEALAMMAKLGAEIGGTKV